MSNGKAKEFRNRKLKALEQQQQQQGAGLQQALISLSMKLFQMDRQIQALQAGNAIAKVADWRSLAVVKLAEEKNLFSEKEVISKVESLQEAFFEEQSNLDDTQRGLTKAADGATAEKGMIAITTIRLYKDGKELDQQRVVRSKVELGSGELVKDLEDAVVGMKVGETKRFALDLQGQTDEAQISLLGLRLKPAKPAEAPKAPEAAAEGASETSGN